MLRFVLSVVAFDCFACYVVWLGIVSWVGAIVISLFYVLVRRLRIIWFVCLFIGWFGCLLMWYCCLCLLTLVGLECYV